MKYKLVISFLCKSNCPNFKSIGEFAELDFKSKKEYCDINEAYKAAEEFNNYVPPNGCKCQCEVVEVK